MRIRGEAVAQAEDGSTLMLYRLVPGTGAAGSVETSCPFWRRRALTANSRAETGHLTRASEQQTNSGKRGRLTTRVRKLDCRHTPAEVAEPAAPPGGSLSPRFETQESAAPARNKMPSHPQPRGKMARSPREFHQIPPPRATKSQRRSTEIAQL